MSSNPLKHRARRGASVCPGRLGTGVVGGALEVFRPADRLAPVDVWISGGFALIGALAGVLLSTYLTQSSKRKNAQRARLTLSPSPPAKTRTRAPRSSSSRCSTEGRPRDVETSPSWARSFRSAGSNCHKRPTDRNHGTGERTYVHHLRGPQLRQARTSAARLLRISRGLWTLRAQPGMCM